MTSGPATLDRFARPPAAMRTAPRRALAWLTSAAALAITMLGCASSSSSPASDSAAVASTEAARQPSAAAPPVADSPALEAHYVVPPSAARKLGYRIGWQIVTEPHGRSKVGIFSVQGDSVFVLDSDNFLTRLRRDDGERVWRLGVADPAHRALGVVYSPEIERVLVTGGGGAIVLDAANGAQIDLQRFGRVASTAPVPFGTMLIYGAPNGQIVWHAHNVGQQWRAYQVASAIRTPPIIQDGLIIATGEDGRVAVIDASLASMLWQVQLLDSIASAPAASSRAVYVAGKDQHLWAFDLRTGRRLWRYLTQSPLTESPALIDTKLYQQIPTEGLVCFDAAVRNTPDGKVLWKAPGVSGNVVAEHRGTLWVWDSKQKQMTLLSASGGHEIEKLSLPRVQNLVFSQASSGECYACTSSGEVIRLDPR